MGQLTGLECRLGQPLAGQPTVADRLDNRGLDLLVPPAGRVRAQAQQVDSGDQRAHGGLGHTDVGARAGHVEGVTDDHPVEAESSPQDVHHLGRERCRAFAVDRGHEDVGGHDGGDSGPDGGLERHQLPRAQHLERGVDSGEGMVRVGDSVAVTREVLGTGRDPGLLQSLDPGCGMAAGERSIGTEAAHPDDGIVG